MGERRYSTMAVPVRRVVVKKSTQRPTKRDGTVAWFVGDGLEGGEESKKTQKYAKERGGKGAPVKVCWPSMGLVRVYLYVRGQVR